MSGIDPESRELFRAGRDALRPSLGDRVRVRDSLRARIEGVFHLPANAPGPALTAGSGLGWLSVSALATSVVVGALLFTPKSPAPAPSAASAPSQQLRPVEAPVAPPLELPSTTPAASVTPPAAPEPRSSTRPRQSDRLAQEVALLSRAETELHAGRFAAALQLLNMHQRSFPRGLLAQERVAARIQALCGLGREKEANADLARSTPGSLHDGLTRQACGRRGSK
ncbi:MAG: hypothetical protein M3020_09805 [Myxococcota bacterium]|nr:hypothetical protein [Myxococcota bacterium]